MSEQREALARVLCKAAGKVWWTDAIPAVHYDQADVILREWLPGALADERVVEAAGEGLFRWNTPTDPHFVIHGRAGDVSDEDPYLPIVRATLSAAVTALTEDDA